MGLFNLLFKRKEEKEENPLLPDDYLSKDIISTANKLIDLAADGFPDLDYSPRSLLSLDQLLRDESETIYDLSSEELESLINMSSCYILESARRKCGGRYFWYARQGKPYLLVGPPDFEAVLLPFDRVKERLINGESESITDYFDRFMKVLEQENNAVIL